MTLSPIVAATRFSTEVAVIGSGVAAVSTALEARRRGRQVLLAAPGAAVAGEITVALHGEVGEIAEPHLAAIRQRVAGLGGKHEGWLDPVLTELVVDRTLAEQGVELLLYATPIALVEGEGRATGVLLGAKDGWFVIAAEGVVDATAEGLLFRNSRVAFSDAATATASRTVYFQFVGDDLSGLPAQVEGSELRARPTWPGEACVTMTGEAPCGGPGIPPELQRRSRLAVEAVSRAAIAAVPGLSGAAVSHTGHEMLPLTSAYLAHPDVAHPTLANVVGAGAWVGNRGHGDAAALAAAGAEAGARAASFSGVSGPAEAHVPVTEERESDVLVAGGGTAGAVAAIAAASEGASTTLVEAAPFLGGIPNGGGIHCYYYGLPGGLQDTLDARADEVADSLGGRDKVRGFHPEARKIVLERMAAEAGVDLRLGSTVVDVLMDGPRVAGVVAVGPGKVSLLRAKVVIDASGDADVAARAGAPCSMGRKTDGLSHAYSQSSGTLRSGKIDHNNFDAGYVDATDIVDLTRARRYGIQLYWRDEGFAADRRLLNLSPLLGLRQSRHIVGEYTLTLADQADGRVFEDVIAYTRGHHDSHAPDFENESDEAHFWCWALQSWRRVMKHGVPYRCLLPKGVDGLLVACRALSVSHDAHMLFRMERDMQRIGEAAGLAAALAVSSGAPLRQVDVPALQAKLRAAGALQEEWGEPVPQLSAEQWAARLRGEDPGFAAWQLYRLGEAAAPALLQTFADGDEDVRWWSAATLAMLGRDEGAEALLETLEARVDGRPEDMVAKGVHWATRVAPHWWAAISLLGKLRHRPALPALAEVLSPPFSVPDPLIAAIRALGRIGDSVAVPYLRAVLDRDDLPRKAPFQDSLGEGQMGPRDVVWPVRLAAADALQQLGSPAPEIVAPYLDDSRAHVRAYARRLAGAGS